MIRTLRAGAAAGMVAGAAMAMWSMLAMAGAGDGFWTPVNLIAHLAWDGAPLDGTFSLRATALGMMMHMATSMMLGMALALMTQTLRLGRIPAAAAGMAGGLGVWASNQYGIWQALDGAAADQFTPWIFAVGHLMFGALAGMLVARPRPATDRTQDPRELADPHLAH